MGLSNIFDIAGSALAAETTRLRTTASNMSNANMVSGSPETVYRAQYPVFRPADPVDRDWLGAAIAAGVVVDGIIEDTNPPIPQYQPNNPMADSQGFVYSPAINYVEEMANMISASRSYQMDIEVMNTAKQLMQRTLQLGD